MSDKSGRYSLTIIGMEDTPDVTHYYTRISQADSTWNAWEVYINVDHVADRAILRDEETGKVIRDTAEERHER